MSFNQEYLTESERARIKAEILKRIAAEYQAGADVHDLRDKYSVEYNERTGDGLSVLSIRNAVSHYVDGKTLKEKKDEVRKATLELSKQGLTREEIGAKLGYSKSYIGSILREEKGNPVRQMVKNEKPLMQSEIDEFSDALNPGDAVHVIMPVPMEDTAGLNIKQHKVRAALRIIDKYKHHCVTDHGDFRWVDMYLWAKEREKQCVSC